MSLPVKRPVRRPRIFQLTIGWVFQSLFSKFPDFNHFNKFNFRNYRWRHRWFKSAGRRTSRKNPNSKRNSKFNIGTSSRSTSIIIALKQLESVKFNWWWIYSTRWRWRTRTTTWTGHITGTCDGFDTRNTSIRVNFGTINQSVSKFTPLF